MVAVEKEIDLDTLGNNAEPLFLLAQIQRDEGDLETAIETMSGDVEMAYMAADMRILSREHARRGRPHR